MNQRPILLAASALILTFVMGLVLLQASHSPTAYASKEPAIEMDIDKIDHVAIDKSELRLCCEFEEAGKMKGCWVLSKYDCSYCEESCRD